MIEYRAARKAYGAASLLLVAVPTEDRVDAHTINQTNALRRKILSQVEWKARIIDDGMTARI